MWVQLLIGKVSDRFIVKMFIPVILDLNFKVVCVVAGKIPNLFVKDFT